MEFKWLCFHRKLRWGVNPSNNNSEPQCTRCSKYITKHVFIDIRRFVD